MVRTIRRPVAVVVLISISLSACHDTLARQGAPTSPASSATLSFSAREYYRGIVFAHGPVADAVPAIRDNARVANWTNNPEQLRAIENIQNRIMAQVERDDPSFFASFAAAMRSGNPLVIDRALKSAARVTRLAITRLPEVRVLREELKANPGLMQDLKEEVAALARDRKLDIDTYESALDASLADVLNASTSEVPDPSASVVALLVFAITFAVVQSYAIGFNIAGAINFYLVVAAVGPGVESLQPGANLGYEQMVRSVAATLE